MELEFVQKIGVLDGDDENYQFFRPLDVAVDNENNIYILDAGNFRIQKFNSDGVYRATFGRQGQGPGELWSPSVLHIDSNNTIFVCDGRNVRIQKYANDGADLGSIRYSISFDFLRFFSSGEMVVNNRRGLANKYSENESLLIILDKAGVPIRHAGRMLKYSNPTTGLFKNQIIGDVGEDDSIVISFAYLNRIEKYSYDGSLDYVADRPLNFEVPSNPDMFEFPAPPGFDAPPMRIPNFSYVSLGISIDGKGRTWILTFRKKLNLDPTLNKEIDPEGDTTELQIFDTDLIFLGTVHRPENAKTPNFRIYEDRVFFIEQLNEMCVYEYKIVEK